MSCYHLSLSPTSPCYALPSAKAIDVAYDNVKTFHEAQAEKEALTVATMPGGVVCSRFVRPISRVGVYVPGGTAILPSTAIHAGCARSSCRVQGDRHGYSTSFRRIDFA